MKFIKDNEGGLVNLSHVSRIYILKSAKFADDGARLINDCIASVVYRYERGGVAGTLKVFHESHNPTVNLERAETYIVELFDKLNAEETK